MKVFHQVRPWAQLAGLALIYRAIATTIWTYLPRHNPITQWLLDTYAGPSSELYYALVFVHDAIVNVLLALPVAYLITRIKPDRRWLYIAAFVLAMFVWDYRVVLFERRDFFDFIFSSGRTSTGFVLYVSYLPAAMLCVSVLGTSKHHKQPNE